MKFLSAIGRIPTTEPVIMKKASTKRCLAETFLNVKLYKKAISKSATPLHLLDVNPAEAMNS
jgi:hypothetical protein